MARRRFALIGQTPNLSSYLTESSAPTLTGLWTFTNRTDFTKAAVAGQYGSTINIYSGNPQVSIHDTGAAANEGVWNIIGGSTTLKVRALSDDFATSADAISIERGTGATVGDVKLTLGSTGALEITGSSYKTNPTGLRLGQYNSTTGYIQAPTAGSVAIWDAATAELARFDGTDNTVHIPKGTLQLGVYASTVGGTLKIAGTTASKNAELRCTNGNLHIDSNDGQYIYLNYYSNTAGTYVSTNGGFRSAPQHTGEFGAVATLGSKGGYGGISLDNNFVLMNSGAAHVGLYDDINNEWMILAYPNSYLSLYYNGLQTLTTRTHGVSCRTSFMATPQGNYFGSDYIHYATPVPGGGLNNNASTQTGYLRINFPTEGSSMMGGFTIRGYNYNSRGGWAVRVDFYEYTDGNGFVNETARILYGTPPFDTVRFGTATGSNGRWILCGTSTTAYSYAQICLTDFFSGYSGQANHLNHANDFDVTISASAPTGWTQEAALTIGGQIRWNSTGKHGGGNVSIGTSAASGGSDGDIHFKY